MKICFIHHEDVVKVVVIQSVQQNLTVFPFTWSWSFIAWTITIFYGWKLKFSCNIRRTVRSDIINAVALLLADRRGFLTKAWRTRSMFSGVLIESCLPGGFIFAADDVSPKFLTHNRTVLRLGTLSFLWILKCQWNIRWVTTTESLFFKYVSTAKARCFTDQRSMATEMLWVSLEGHSKINFPRQKFHSQLRYQIVRYFCRTCVYVPTFQRRVLLPVWL